nr:family 43 glycosylhydrolase [Propioniciclava coleopterorum]
MFATFHAAGALRASHILRADAVQGPYEPWSDGPITPPGWQCLDATLFVAEDGTPWTVFCHEWQQVHDGGMWAMPLTPDLRRAAGRPVWLFNASEAPWTRPLALPPHKARPFDVHVTDGPFLHRTASGALLMLWSSFTDAGYAMGVARSASGEIVGPWEHEPEPLIDGGCGHGMVFRDLDGALRATYHTPNDTPNERLVIRTLLEDGDRLRLAD